MFFVVECVAVFVFVVIVVVSVVIVMISSLVKIGSVIAEIMIIIIIINISEPNVYKNIIHSISGFDQRKSFYRVQGLDQKNGFIMGIFPFES